jgi:hypothetical protein
MGTCNEVCHANRIRRSANLLFRSISPASSASKGIVCFAPKSRGLPEISIIRLKQIFNFKSKKIRLARRQIRLWRPLARNRVEKFSAQQTSSIAFIRSLITNCVNRKLTYSIPSRTAVSVPIRQKQPDRANLMRSLKGAF